MLRRAAILAALVFAVGGMAAEQPAQADSANAPTKPVRICYGGLDDGKTIVRRGQVTDNAIETTLNACRIDGGSAVRAPQSPTIATGRPVIA